MQPVPDVTGDVTGPGCNRLGEIATGRIFRAADRLHRPALPG
jgi:hypothetical protein